MIQRQIRDAFRHLTVSVDAPAQSSGRVKQKSRTVGGTASRRQPRRIAPHWDGGGRTHTSPTKPYRPDLSQQGDRT
jgi:hypothetical protein